MLIFPRRHRSRTRVSGVQVTGVHIAGCNCPKATAFLAEIGCEHAAKMHAHPNLAADTWSGYDWLLHMWEEDTRLFPLCDANDPRVALLRAHHGIFRMEIALYGRIVSLGLLAIHSRIEDEIVDELLQRRAA